MQTLTTRLARGGDFLRDHAGAVRKLQWCIVVIYAVLLIVPVTLPLPDETAHVFNNLGVFAQFAFWGIWWPFVLLSMPLVGRSWCGIFCPEGTLTEWASERGRHRHIPHWMRWGGWPFIAFALTTIYGQLVSVYQYPAAAMLVLGGSTFAAMAVGYWYGRSKRIWCRYLCPVNGVFNLLARLSPIHFKVDAQAWRAHPGRTVPVNCAPLVPLRHMQGAGDCHMCGRCSGHREAITLAARSPEHEIAHVAQGDKWQTRLIVFGLIGIAMGAFMWSSSPWYVTVKQAIATWLIDRDIVWPLLDNAPWWLLTHYPEVGDSFSWLDGICILGFIFATTSVAGGALRVALWLADRSLPQRTPDSVHALAQGLIPLAGCGVFLGLSMTTLQLLRHEGFSMHWANGLRFAMLVAALIWSLRLLWRIAERRQPSGSRASLAVLLAALGTLPFLACWVLLFVIW